MPLAHHQYRAARGSPNGASTLAALFKSVTMKPITSPIRTATISSYSLPPQRNGRVKPRCAACGQSRCYRGNDQKERRHACESSRVVHFDADEHARHCACETESRNHADKRFDLNFATSARITEAYCEGSPLVRTPQYMAHPCLMNPSVK